MALPLLNNAESQASGTTVTTGNSGGTDADAFNGVTIGGLATLTYDSTQAAHGTNSFKYTIGTTNQPTHVIWTGVGGVTEISGAVYLHITANPASTIRMIELRNAGAAVMILGFPNNQGKFQWKLGSDASVGTNVGTAFTLNQWNRIEFHLTFNTTTGAGEARWFPGDGTTQTGPDETFSAANSGAACDEIRIGMNSASTTVSYTWWMDSFKIVAGSALPIGPGPYTSGGPPPPEGYSTRTGGVVSVGP